MFAAGVINHLSLRSLTITLTVCSHDKAIQCSQKLQQDAPSATSIQVFHPQIHEQSSQAHSRLTGGEYLNNQALTNAHPLVCPSSLLVSRSSLKMKKTEFYDVG